MAKKLILLLILFSFYTCKKNELDCCVNHIPVDITLKFNHNWNGTPISASDFNNFKFTTENGESISINRLRYVLSNIGIGSQKFNYHLIDLEDISSLELPLETITENSTYHVFELSFTFGFTDEDNKDGVYQDLNSVNFNVPAMMGGGYHYMQLDGKYKDANNQDANFNYHAIRAVDRTDPNNLILEDTSFKVIIDSFIPEKNKVIIDIDVNIAEWFKNPNTWNLNVLNTVLMPNFDAQKLMSANGKTVFSLQKITQKSD